MTFSPLDLLKRGIEGLPHSGLYSPETSTTKLQAPIIERKLSFYVCYGAILVILF